MFSVSTFFPKKTYVCISVDDNIAVVHFWVGRVLVCICECSATVHVCAWRPDNFCGCLPQGPTSGFGLVSATESLICPGAN